jgi:redox-sensing transcriptional repressor
MMQKHTLPIQTVERLCHAYHRLGDHAAKGVIRVSSTELGAELGSAPHNIRKDISRLGGGEVGNTGAGYEAKTLRDLIGRSLRLDTAATACIVGLGRLGTALLNYEQLPDRGCRIVAAFDADINRLETIQTAVPVFPSYEISDVVKRLGIELAFLTVPAHAAQEAAGRLSEGGIRGILNFTPTAVRSSPGVVVRNVDIMGEFAVLTALVRMDGNSDSFTPDSTLNTPH